MNTKRKAELQRKLSMASVPKPPADLASRIKQDIPPSIGVARPAATRWGGASMRIAASLIVVVASAYLAVRLLSRAPSPEGPDAIGMAARAARSIAPPQRRAAAQAAEPATPPIPVESESAKGAPVVAAPAFAPESGAGRLKKEGDHVASVDRARHSEAPTPVAADLDLAPATRDRNVNAAAPPPPAPATVARAAPLPVAQQAAVPQKITVTAAAPAGIEGGVERALRPAPAQSSITGVAGGVISETGRPAAESKYALRKAATAHAPSAVAASIAPSMFGISTDPVAMEIVRNAVERGEQPPVVNVEAIVNYFAGVAEEPPRRMSLQVEGSPPPVAATPSTRIVRVTIDTPRSDAADAPVAATDANLVMAFDDHAVASQRLIGGSASLNASQQSVLKNTSVTALYEIRLQPGLSNRQKVVTARLTYRDGSTGRAHTLTALLRTGDIDRAWLDASRRHRLATLGAIWGESLKSSIGGADVARRAEELANQEPRDRKAHELAELATASSRRRNSGPTGSGR